MMAITLDQQIACVRRELAMRKRVYAKWVQNGRMKQETATHEIDAMQAVHDTLAFVKETAGKGERLF